MKSRRLLILAGALVLVLALLFKAPAALVYGLLLPKDRALPVQLYGVDGSLLDGSVAGVVLNGRTLLADLRWTLNPLALLAGRASLTLSTGKEPILLDGAVSRSVLGSTRVSDLRLNSALRPLAAAIGYPFIPVDGQIGLELTSLSATGTRITAAEGNAQLVGLVWALGANPAPLGDFRADLANEGDDIVARLASVSGPLELTGEARLLPDQSYTTDIRIKPKPEAPPIVQNMLRQLGQPDPQGFYQLRRSGSLQPAGAP